MSQVDYEYECSRAELLGLPRPTWEEFCANAKLRPENEESDTADVQADIEILNEQVEDLAADGDAIKRTGGGLDELNAILANTQHKINKFKTVCGSFTNLMKLKSWRGEPSANPEEGGSSSVPATPNRRIGGGGGDGGVDMNVQVADQVDRLDSLIGKAERAEISMNVQSKQMRHHINK